MSRASESSPAWAAARHATDRRRHAVGHRRRRGRRRRASARSASAVATSTTAPPRTTPAGCRRWPRSGWPSTARRTPTGGPLDEQTKALDAHKFTYGAILAGSPKWNTKDAPGTLPVHNLPGWSRYVTELAKHVKGRVKRFEVWNEPPNFTGKDQTPADYAKIVVASYDAVKAVDPTALVGLAAKSAHVNYLEQVIKAGAKDHFDCAVKHP